MNQKKVLFVFPNTGNRPVIPNAIAIFAGIAKKLGWEVGYFDTHSYKKTSDSSEDRELSGEFKAAGRGVDIRVKDFDEIQLDLQKIVDDFVPDIIAFSAISFEYQFLNSFLPKITTHPSTLRIIGGIHAILQPEEIFGSKLFDVVCIGEGEETFHELLVKFECQEELFAICNTYFRDRTTGNEYRNSRRPLISKDRLWANTPDYTLFGEEYFEYPFDGHNLKRLNFETSRGCPYTCTYCGNSAVMKMYKGLGRYVRERAVTPMVTDLVTVVNTYDIELIYFQDECFLAHDVKWLTGFADAYKKAIGRPFIIQTRPETVTEEKLVILKNCAPFFQISMGIESGSEKILHDVCNRKVEIDHITEVFLLCRKLGIRTCAFFMIGLPYETRENIFESIELCRKINSDVAIVSIFQPLPGQKLRDVCIDEGYIRGDEQLPTFTSGSILTMPQITSAEISALRRVFLLYAKLPEKYHDEIKQCERDFENNADLYKGLVDMRWRMENKITA